MASKIVEKENAEYIFFDYHKRIGSTIKDLRDDLVSQADYIDAEIDGETYKIVSHYNISRYGNLPVEIIEHVGHGSRGWVGTKAKYVCYVDLHESVLYRVDMAEIRKNLEKGYAAIDEYQGVKTKNVYIFRNRLKTLTIEETVAKRVINVNAAAARVKKLEKEKYELQLIIEQQQAKNAELKDILTANSIDF